MKGKVEFTVLSTVPCFVLECRRKIKQNVVNRKLDDQSNAKNLLLKCYKHYCEEAGKDPRARKVNRKELRRRIDRII